MTTGATLEAAARVVKKAGATHVDAMVFAQA
jgi:predicted amidophosphoribosyltransferase